MRNIETKICGGNTEANQKLAAEIEKFITLLNIKDVDISKEFFEGDGDLYLKMSSYNMRKEYERIQDLLGMTFPEVEIDYSTHESGNILAKAKK